MQYTSRTLFWRRIDTAGLERMTLDITADSVSVAATLLCLEDGGFRLDHRWRLTGDWRALSLEVEKHGPAGPTRRVLERAEGGWMVDGARCPDLEGAAEPDLSVTPFCNSLPIRRLRAEGGESLTLDVCYVDAATMGVARSRQRYDRLGPDLFRYVDLGLSAGFEADLRVDEMGLVLAYEHLFERLSPV